MISNRAGLIKFHGEGWWEKGGKVIATERFCDGTDQSCLFPVRT